MADIDLVTLDQAKAVLRVDGDDDDLALGIHIATASAVVIKHMGASALAFMDTGGDVILGEVPPQVAGATLWLVGYLYLTPDQDEEKMFSLDTLPAPVTAMLATSRDPVCA